MRMTLLAFLILLVVFCRIEANPVPDAVAAEFRELVVSTAKDGHCRDPVGLAGHFAAYGLDLLSASDVKAIEKRFDVFAPIIVSAQSPSRCPNDALQRLYREHANSNQKSAMLKVLRDWFTDPVTEAPLEGGMRISWPASAEQAHTVSCRVIAAEMLADWGDAEAIPLLDRFAKSDSLPGYAQWRLDRARKRLIDPTAVTLLKVDSNGKLWVCPKEMPVRRALIRRGNWSGGKDGYILSEQEIRELWPLMRSSGVCANTNWAGYNYAVVLELENGIKASLSPTEPGHVVYTDNTSLDYFRTRVTMDSDALWDWIWTLFERHLDEKRH